MVLERCLYDRCHGPRGLKDNLPLLAVCRLWRHLAIPLVYSSVYVRCKRGRRNKGGPSTGNANVEEPTKVKIKTNLDLIAMAGCASAVKNIDIHVSFLVSPFPGWRKVIRRMGAVASRWHVVELEVAMDSNFDGFDGNNVDMAMYADDVAELGDALAQLMPNVRRLECHEDRTGLLARSLYGRMASHYGGQLDQLNCPHPITVASECRFTKLANVYMDYKLVADYRLPRMASGELVCMSLRTGPPNHSWAPFSADGDSQLIEFTKLNELSVEYNTAYMDNEMPVRHRDGHPWELHFPSLEMLSIRSNQQTCPLLEYAVLPARMASIDINMHSAAYLDIANVVLPATKRLTFQIGMFPHGDASGFPAINRIMENARGCESLELTIAGDMLAVAPESLTCSTLTRLTVLAPTGVDAMLALLERLPNLADLFLYLLDARDVRADISIPGANEDSVVAPLRTSLRVLVINYNKWAQPPGVVLAVMKFMMLSIPTLTVLTSIPDPGSPLAGFVEEYAPRHPHLLNVELQVEFGRLLA
ncbi:hypothetical protein H4R21_003020 [Coemansia helicoidea]|uniref:Uncharacterized protein n=1 Tax=Coemansia helicoidea TaxID=1286919 RepID=A0ACC1L4T9_9FUNG|nr:hypothetical protein H4R21_003020 [Coemansia helicoidea]